MIRSLLGGVCGLWWQGSIISIGAPWGYIYTFSATVLLLFSQAKDWKLHNSHPYLRVTQRATVCYTGPSGSVSPLLSVGFTELKPIQVRHQSGGHWQLLTEIQPAQAQANSDKSWELVLSCCYKACVWATWGEASEKNHTLEHISAFVILQTKVRTFE